MAIDGTYLKADANPKSFHTKATLEKGMKCVEKSIAAYYQEMDEQDARDEECAIGSINEEDLEQGAKIEALVERRRDNWTVRHDWLNQYLFESIGQVQECATKWLWTYNNERRGMGLGGITPKQKLAMVA